MKTLLSVGASVLFTISVAGQYAITELPPCGASVASLAGINERGAVAWLCRSPENELTGFLSRRTGIEKISILHGELRAINRHEQIAGYVAMEGNYWAAVWTDGIPNRIGINGTVASAINDHGVIAGGMDVLIAEGQFTTHAFVYRDGVFQDLGRFGHDYAVATALNNKGTILLDLSDASGQGMGFYEKGVFRKVAPFANGHYGIAINEAGNVTGHYITPDGRGSAFFYRGGHFLAVPRRDETYSIGTSINDRDELVGYWEKRFMNEVTQGGFLYKDGVLNLPV